MSTVRTAHDTGIFPSFLPTPMASEAEALGQCIECAATYPLYRKDGEWRALGTDGNCRCGNGEFTVLSGDELADPD